MGPGNCVSYIEGSAIKHARYGEVLLCNLPLLEEEEVPVPVPVPVAVPVGLPAQVTGDEQALHVFGQKYFIEHVVIRPLFFTRIRPLQA